MTCHLLFERVHSLDIGAVTPEEIAVAITAELTAERRHVERDLPHMSWFHRGQAKRLDAVDENAEAGDGQAKSPPALKCPNSASKLQLWIRSSDGEPSHTQDSFLSGAPQRSELNSAGPARRKCCTRSQREIKCP